jgi:hypothetical protein
MEDGTSRKSVIKRLIVAALSGTAASSAMQSVAEASCPYGYAQFNNRCYAPDPGCYLNQGPCTNVGICEESPGFEAVYMNGGWGTCGVFNWSRCSGGFC